MSLGLFSAAMIGALGCHDNTPPPSRVPVPAERRAQDWRSDSIAQQQRDDAKSSDADSMDSPRVESRLDSDHDAVKPLPPPMEEGPRPPFDDAPLVNQQPPEQPAFLDAYRRVGNPRIVLFVNRTLEGDVLPVNENNPIISAQLHETANGKTTSKDAAIYLQPGQYDEADAKSLDYEAIETIMTDWFAANGQVTIVSPTLARQRLTDQQVKDLQSGRPAVLREIAQQLDADVLIQVQAHPTRQTSAGLEVRLVAEAMNTKGGESLGRAVVDLPPPLEKTTINRYTRFLARKLMDDMTGSWTAAPPEKSSPERNSPEKNAPEQAPDSLPQKSPAETLPAPASGSTGPGGGGHDAWPEIAPAKSPTTKP